MAVPLVPKRIRESESHEPSPIAGRINVIADQFGTEGGEEALGVIVAQGRALAAQTGDQVLGNQRLFGFPPRVTRSRRSEWWMELGSGRLLAIAVDKT